MSQLIVGMSTMATFMFGLMKHPMSMGIVLMAQTLLICLFTNSLAQNAWFSYILFLVFMGGMLVLFIYLTSVASNELFGKKNYKAIISWVVVMMLLLPAMWVLEPLMLTNSSENAKSMKIEGMVNLTSMFNYPYNLMTIAVIVYLFLTLIVVVKITESHSGPLRMNN
uniref:NADH-ubiquinone oxidoreductase chain 6 n=1 Tax=Calopteryx splendens TaxID=52612 RepID=A0A7G7CED1_CALSD|nr:NADH dehydrogenase subunit 6 [Calopteryx splendens]